MGLSSNTGMSFRTRLPSSNPRAGIRCSAPCSRNRQSGTDSTTLFLLCISKVSMDNLLKLAIEAHGGLERWRQFKVVRANVSITGAVWHLKRQRNVLKNGEI